MSIVIASHPLACLHSLTERMNSITFSPQSDITLTGPSLLSLLFMYSRFSYSFQTKKKTVSALPLPAMELMQLPMKISVLLLLLLLIVDAETNATSITTRTATSAKDLAAVGESKPAGPWASSTWLKKVVNPQGPRAKTGCQFQPSICYRERSEAGNPIPPFQRRRCCKNRCLDVSSDVNNCGFCTIRCPFAWQCCNGLCIDTKMNPFHCGNCNTQCRLGNSCFYGMCGYSDPFPPFPFPLPPRHPKPHTPISYPHPTPMA